MPAYDYQCQECEDTVTIVCGINDPRPTPECLKCKQDMTRQFNLGAVTFKGTGFYSTTKGD